MASELIAKIQAKMVDKKLETTKVGEYHIRWKGVILTISFGQKRIVCARNRTGQWIYSAKEYADNPLTTQNSGRSVPISDSEVLVVLQTICNLY